MHAEDLVVDAQHGLEVAVLVGELGGEHELHLVVGRSDDEGRQQPGDLPLGVEAVGEDPAQALRGLVVEPRVALRVDR